MQVFKEKDFKIDKEPFPDQIKIFIDITNTLLFQIGDSEYC